MAYEVLNLTRDRFEEQVTRSEQPVLVDFYAEWCAPCRALSTVVDDLAREYGDRISVAKVNVDTEPGLAARFGVQALPTVLLMEGGRVVKRFVGYHRKEQLVHGLGLAA